MPNYSNLVFILILVCFANLASGQDLGVEDPLPEFLSRLSASTQSVNAIKFSSSGGPEVGYEKIFRSKGKLGVIGDAGERGVRAIWNPKYRAVVEKIDQKKWMLQKVNPHDDKENYESQNVVGLFIGPLNPRLAILEFVGVTKETDGSWYEYQYASDCPVYSPDPVLNSFLIKFDESSKTTRIQEIRHWEGGDPVRISSKTIFEYPGDSFFPLKRIGKAVVMGGEMGGTKFEKVDWVEIDTDAKFVSSECYLSHYGLPEPNIPSNYAWLNRPITWMVGGFVLVLCFILLVSRYRRGR